MSGLALRRLEALRGGMGADEFEAVAVNGEMAERKARPFVHGLVVVDDGEFPAGLGPRLGASLGFGKFQKITRHGFVDRLERSRRLGQWIVRRQSIVV
ncbi:hypothetical protein OH818_12045 [Jiella pelagia]|uniref:Uncharacterized protein n=1 Tax=Jiella pelagia TaxID=2986949 RepID=A0ABY7C783_9HYPH|nr:hypothetical protein [Jiella pelagia]WAP70675.1 hypothetical protein OH818_12045 [Jiella pelagia]